MVFKSRYFNLIVDLLKIQKDESFLRKAVFFNDCYKRCVLEKNLRIQFKFYSVHLIMFLLLIEKVYIYCANLDKLEVIIFMELFEMIELNPYMNFIQIFFIINTQYTYHAFYIAIDDYFTFHLNAVLNDDCKALFGSYYVYKGYLATKYIRVKMLKTLKMFFIPDFASGL